VRAIRVTDNLIQLTRARFVNAYLAREEDGFTLVDTTMGGAADALLSAAKGAGSAIRRIALTHGHSDHVGSLDSLKQRLGDSVEVLMPDVDARVHAGEQVRRQASGVLAEARGPPRRAAWRRRRGGKPRGRPDCGARPRARRFPRHARRNHDCGGHLHGIRSARGRQPLLPAVPIRRDGQLGQDAGARVGSSSAFTRSDTPRRRARPRGSRPRLGDGSGDQPSPRLPVDGRCAGARRARSRSASLTFPVCASERLARMLRAPELGDVRREG
jgi:Metallo-beta-lactamase superfamily